MDMMALRRTLMDKAYEPPYTECVETGNPVAFTANATKNMKISVPSAQEGATAKIWVTGTNIWDEEYENTQIESDGSITTAYTRICSKNHIPVVPGATYMMIWPGGLNRGRGGYYNANKEFIQYCGDFPDNITSDGTKQYGTFTVPSGAYYVKFCTNASYGTTYNDNISLNYPANDLEYHAYSGQEYSVTLPVTNIPAKNGNNVVTCSLNADMQVKFYCDNPKEEKLVIMTYNVQNFTGLNADKDLQEDILEEYDPSIVGLQEIGQLFYPSSVKEYLTDDYWTLVSGNQPTKSAIASKYGLSNVQYHDFTTNGGQVKGYQTAEFKFKGKTIFFVNAHTISSGSATENAAQCAELLNLVANKETFIIVGDLNTDLSSTSGTQYVTCIKPFIDAGYKLANCQSSFIGTYTSGKTDQGTWYSDDNIICSADFTMSNVRRDTLKITAAGVQDKVIDHVALICELTL